MTIDSDCGFRSIVMPDSPQSLGVTSGASQPSFAILKLSIDLKFQPDSFATSQRRLELPAGIHRGRDIEDSRVGYGFAEIKLFCGRERVSGI